MIRYLLRRLLSGILILLLFATAMFFAVQVLLPGDFVSHMVPVSFLSPREVEELRQQLGLDLPIGLRYLNWLSRLLRGDLGNSYSGVPVIEILKSAFLSTLFVFGIGTVLAFIIGQWLGKVTAWRRSTPFSSLATFTTILLYTSFPPWLAFLLMFFFVDKLGFLSTTIARSNWTPRLTGDSYILAIMIVGLVNVALALGILNIVLQWLWRRGLPAGIFLFLLLFGWVGTWYVFGFFSEAVEILQKAALSIVTYTLLTFGETMLITRTAMVDALHEDHVQTARAKGLSDRAVRDRHVARNAMLPVVSRLVVSIPLLMTGAAMIEQTLNWAGVGWVLFYAVGRQDIPLIMGSVLVIGVLSLAARLTLDVLHVLIDPRVRSGGQVSRRYL